MSAEAQSKLDGTTRGLGLLLIGTAKFNLDRVVDILAVQPIGNLPGLVIGEIAVLGIGHNKHGLDHIETLDSIDPGLGNSLGKTADRDGAGAAEIVRFAET